jgi:hypothetical protein
MLGELIYSYTNTHSKEEASFWNEVYEKQPSNVTDYCKTTVTNNVTGNLYDT